MATAASHLDDARAKDPYACGPSIDFSKHIDTTHVKGQTAVVTGGASGMGLGIATALAAAGAFVVLSDISPAGEAVAEGLRAKGGNAIFVVCDVASWDSQKALFALALAHSPSHRIDLVVPCAGLGGAVNATLKDFIGNSARPSLDAGPPAPSPLVMDVNLTGVYYSVNLALWYFRATADQALVGAQDQKQQPSRHILLVSSLAGYVPLIPALDYNAAKFGVRGLFKAVRDFPQSVWAVPGGVRVNMLAPTFIESGMVSQDAAQGLREAAFKVGVIEDVVQGMMRCICDESIFGRSVCIAAGTPPGSANFDLCDDFDGQDAGRALVERLKDGTLGTGFVSLRDFQVKNF